MDSSKVSLGGLSGAFDDVYRAYKIECAMHKKPMDKPDKAFANLELSLDSVRKCVESGVDALDLHSSLAALAGLTIRAMVDLE